VSVFLQGFPKILRDMAELERHIPTLIPEHRRNPENVRHCPKGPDWRVLMAWFVKESDPSISEKVKEISAALEVLNKKKASKKDKVLRSKLQDLDDHVPTVVAKQVGHEAMGRLPEMLRVWLLSTCNPGSQTMHQFLLDYECFSQWWRELPPQLTKSQTILMLHSFLNQENNPPLILNLLDDLLVQSILLKAQSLYEELLPTFMDLKTSNSTLHSLREEASREDAQLKSILDNSDLYKQIESHIASAIKSAVEPLMEECLKQTTDEDLKTRVREAFGQAMKDALAGKSDSPRKEGVKENQDLSLVR